MEILGNFLNRNIKDADVLHPFLGRNFNIAGRDVVDSKEFSSLTAEENCRAAEVIEASFKGLKVPEGGELFAYLHLEIL